MIRSFLVLFFSFSLLAGCTTTPSNETPDLAADSSTPPQTEDQSTPALTPSAQPLQIMASFYPIAFMAEQVVGDKGLVKNMVGNHHVHDYRLTPRDLQDMTTADLVLLQGEVLEPWAHDIGQVDLGGTPVYEIFPLLSISTDEDTLAMKSAESMHKEDDHDMHEDDHHDEHKTDDHHDDHDHDTHVEEEAYDTHHDDHADEGEMHADHNDHHDHHGHNHGGVDPHTWVDPLLALDMLHIITEKIILIDPANEEYYQENAQMFGEKLLAIDEAYKSALATCTPTGAFITHDVFGYLEIRYGFKFTDLMGLSGDARPSAQKIQAMITQAKEESITHILIDPNGVDTFGQLLQAEANLEALPVVTMENSQTPLLDAYELNKTSLLTAFGCQ